MPSQSLVMTALCAILLSSSGCFISQAKAAGDINRGYDWTLQAETEELDGYFKYKNSQLKPLDKVGIVYYKGDVEQGSKPYEKMWYHDGKPLGIERTAPLTGNVVSGESIRLKIKHHDKNPQPNEYKAAANAILRVWLDAHLNKNQLVVVNVPDAKSLHAIADELTLHQNLSAVPEGNPENGEHTTMTLLMESEADGSQVYLAYY